MNGLPDPKKLMESSPFAQRTKALEALLIETKLYDFMCITAGVVAGILSTIIGWYHMTPVNFAVILAGAFLIRYGLRSVVWATWVKKCMAQIDEQYPPER